MVWLNLLILAFLLGMAFFWSTYGLFSAVLHLGVVIVAGALAFAIYEPLAGVLLGRMPNLAWGLALLGPFAILLIVLRVVADKTVCANVQVQRLTGQIGGGVVGLVAGYLTAGVTLIGIGFLPMGTDILGYAPYQVSGNQIQPNDEGQLWMPLQVDTAAAGFFSMLSGGAFEPTLSEPTLASHRPGIDELAARTRLKSDTASSSGIVPDSVDVLGYHVVPADADKLQNGALTAALAALATKPGEDVQVTPATGSLAGSINAIRRNNPDAVASIQKGYAQEDEKPNPTLGTLMQRMLKDLNTQFTEGLRTGLAANRRLILVDTAWKRTGGTFDVDNKLRIGASQVFLLTESGEKIPALAASRFSAARGGRVLQSFAAGTAQVGGTRDTELITFVFSLTDNQAPKSVWLRGSRFTLSRLDQGTDDTKITVTEALLLGAPPMRSSPPDNTTGVTASGGIAVDGIILTSTTELPRAISANNATGVSRTEDELAVAIGTEAPAPKSKGSAKIKYLDVTGDYGMVRMEVPVRKAYSLYGQGLNNARNLQDITLTDQYTSVYSPAAYVLLKKEGDQFIGFNRSGYRNLRAMEQVYRQGTNEDVLYIYFVVPINSEIRSMTYQPGASVNLPEPLKVVQTTRR